MKKRLWIRALFAIVGLYDLVLGLAFLFAPAAIYDRMGVPPPNHWGYVQFPAALLIVFALMFFAVARAPAANRNLIPYGVLLKASYCGIVFYHHFAAGGIPTVWLTFAMLDLLGGAAMLAAWLALPARQDAPR